MSFQYLHKMRCKGTHFFPYMQEQNAYHVIFSANLAVFSHARLYKSKLFCNFAADLTCIIVYV